MRKICRENLTYANLPTPADRDGSAGLRICILFCSFATIEFRSSTLGGEGAFKRPWPFGPVTIMSQKPGKKYTAAAQQVEAKPYQLSDAVSLVQKVKFTKFDETV